MLTNPTFPQLICKRLSKVPRVEILIKPEETIKQRSSFWIKNSCKKRKGAQCSKITRVGKDETGLVFKIHLTSLKNVRSSQSLILTPGFIFYLFLFSLTTVSNRYYASETQIQLKRTRTKNKYINNKLYISDIIGYN